MKNYDIHERIFQFIVEVIKFLNKLPRTSTNLIFISQATRSVTSMGANDQEADGTATKKDFMHCYTTVRKEGKETVFWVRIIQETNGPKFFREAEHLIVEGKEIVAIISAILRNTGKSTVTRK